MYDTREFEFEGKTYEVRITSDGCTKRVRVFHNNKPANGYSYSVDLLTEFSIKSAYLPIDPVEDLVKTAINDVKQKMWERYLKALQELKNKSST